MVSPIFWHENLKPWWFHVIRKSNKLKPQVSAPALGGFTKLENKINWNQRFRLLPDLPPPPRSGGLSACRLPPRSGARQIRQEPNTSGFNFFIFEFREYHLRQEQNTWGFNFLIFVSHEYHPRFSSFSCQNIGEYHQKFPNNSMKSRSQNKKNMRGFYWNHALAIFLQKYSCYFLQRICSSILLF